MRKQTTLFIFLVLLMLTFAQSTPADFTVINNSTTETVAVIYSYWDLTQNAWRIQGYYHVKPQKSRKLSVPENVDTVYARIWSASRMVKHDRKEYQSSAVHPQEAFNVVYLNDGTIIQSDVPQEELVTRTDFYGYPNNSPFTFTQFQDEEAPVNIPDPNLRAAIEEALGKAPGDTITTADMAVLTELNPSANISDLTGLEQATNLTYLVLGGHSISDISAVARLTNLTTLYLDYNSISDISAVARLTNLTELYLGNNSISDISAVARLTNLTALVLGDNSISDISAVARLTNLTYLGLGGHSISDISAVARLTNLTALYLDYNSISDISAGARLTNLTYLVLGGNSISDISAVARLTNLTELYLDYNSISDISAGARLTNLTYLRLDNNSISDISAVARLTNLTYLRLGNNSISDISPLVANTGLGDGIVVDVKGNPLSSLSLITHISALHSRGVRVDFDNVPVDIPDPNLRAAIKGELGKAPGTPIMLWDMQTLTRLVAETDGLQDLTGLEFATNLTTLYLSGNDISDVTPLAQLKNLKHLHLYNNPAIGCVPAGWIDKLDKVVASKQLHIRCVPAGWIDKPDKLES